MPEKLQTKEVGLEFSCFLNLLSHLDNFIPFVIL